MCADNPTPVLPPVLPGPITERNGESWLRDEIHEGGATAALWLGIASLPLLVVWPFFVDIFRLAPVVVGGLAVIVGVWSAVLAIWRPKTYDGKWRALIGAGLGLFSTIAFWPLVSSYMFRDVLSACTSNLSGIGQALRVYYQDNGAFPPNLTPLIEQGLATERSLQCPFASSAAASSRIDYVYVSGLRPGGPPDWILAYDRPTNHEDGDCCVLYVGGEVKHFSAAEFARELERFREAYERARGQPPTIVDGAASPSP